MTCLKVTHFLNFLEILKKYEKYLLRVSRSRVHKLRFIRPSRKNRQTDRKTVPLVKTRVRNHEKILSCDRARIVHEKNRAVIKIRAKWCQLKSVIILGFKKSDQKVTCLKVTCLKVTHFWEFGWTKNVSLFSTTVYNLSV